MNQEKTGRKALSARPDNNMTTTEANHTAETDTVTGLRRRRAASHRLEPLQCWPCRPVGVSLLRRSAV